MSRFLPLYPPYSGTAAMVVSTLVWAALPMPLTLAQSITPATDGAETQVVPNGSVYDITGGTRSGDGANLFHSFQQFGLTPAEVANFMADPTVQNILARVTGGNVSVIDGLLQVTGSDANLYLINPAGILFGPNAVLNLDGSFTATTGSAIGFGENWLQAMGDASYASLNGDPTGLAFGENAAALINAGNLTVTSGETLALVGGSVINTGILSAPGGQIVVMAVPGENLVRITPEGARLSLELATLPDTAPAAPTGLSPLDIPSLLRAGGTDIATGITVNPDGTVSLVGPEEPLPTTSGTTLASGRLDASGETGGTVYILGELVGVVDGDVNVSGTAGGGTILVGGDYQGQGEVPNARRTYISSGSEISANATSNGNGGEIIVWSDLATQAYGRFYAGGGTASGDGGFVEISGLEFLDFAGAIDLGAPQGNIGTLLLDPTNIEIVAGAGNSGLADNDNFADPDIASTNTISNTGIDSATANVILQATNDITFSAPITISQENVGLMAQAGNNITVNSTIATNGGNITLSGDALLPDGVGGVVLNPGSSLQTTGGTIEISGSSNIGDGVLISAPVRSGGGNISFTGSSTGVGGLSRGIVILAPVDSGGGDITFIGNSESVGGVSLSVEGGITSQGGDISITGTSNGISDIVGAGIQTEAQVDSGGGAITFTGTSDLLEGISIRPGSTITSQGGTIFLTGSSRVLSGIGISPNARINSGGGAITFTGISEAGLEGATDRGAIYIEDSITSRGGDITLTGSGEYNNGITTFSSINSEGGNISFTGTSSGSRGIETSAPIISGGGAITFNGTSTRDSGIRTIGEITSGGGDIVFTGSTRDIDGIWATAPINSGGGNISFTGKSTNFHGIHFRTLDSQGGAITLVGNSDLSEGIFGEGLIRSSGGTVNLTANRSSVDIVDIITTGGDINIQAETSLFANNLDSSNNSPGGDVSLRANDSITVNTINTQGSTTGGAISVVTPGTFRALGSFLDRANELTSISSFGAISGGEIQLAYGPTLFTVGDASLNGTLTALNSGTVTLRPGPESSFFGSQVFGGGQPGTIQLLSSGDFFVNVEDPEPEPEPERVVPEVEEQLPTTSSTGNRAQPGAVLVSSGDVLNNSQIQQAEQEIVNEFTNHFGSLAKSAQPVSIAQSKATLQDIQTKTGEVPAFLYVRFNRNTSALDPDTSPKGPVLELLLITPDDEPKRVEVLHTNRSEILAVQEKLRRQITNPNLTNSTAYLQAAQQLYNWIIAPLQPDLEAAGVTNIGFIMDSGLRTLPLAALHDGEQFLVERYSLGLIPSVGLIDTEYVNLNRQTSSLIVAGSAEFINQPALWAANLEMQTIHDFWTGSALTGSDFTVAGLQKTRQQAGMIHMATHAEFLRGAPSNSYLQFFDRRLRLSEVSTMGWYAPQVELVTLSACQTAMGNLDAELGFAGFALQAGAKSALASLWKVSDEATAGLMVTFYQQLNQQATKAETLRQAQLAMIRGEVYTDGGQLVLPNQALPLPSQLMTDSLQSFSHPFYWAAFTMVGSPW